MPNKWTPGACCFYSSEQTSDSTSLTVSCPEMPRVCLQLSFCLSRILSKSDQTRSALSLQQCENRERLCLESSTDRDESPKGWRCTRDNTVALCLDEFISLANIRANAYTHMQAHKINSSFQSWRLQTCILHHDLKIGCTCWSYFWIRDSSLTFTYMVFVYSSDINNWI